MIYSTKVNLNGSGVGVVKFKAPLKTALIYNGSANQITVSFSLKDDAQFDFPIPTQASLTIRKEDTEDLDIRDLVILGGASTSVNVSFTLWSVI